MQYECRMSVLKQIHELLAQVSDVQTIDRNKTRSAILNSIFYYNSFTRHRDLPVAIVRVACTRVYEKTIWLSINQVTNWDEPLELQEMSRATRSERSGPHFNVEECMSRVELRVRIHRVHPRRTRGPQRQLATGKWEVGMEELLLRRGI